MATVAVLGTTGMLGNSVVQEFAKYDGELIGSARNKQTDKRLARSFSLEANSNDLPKPLVDLGEGDFVINCIGVIKPYIDESSASSRKNALLINGLFPYALETLANKRGFKIIQIATDCVFSGTKGNYIETDFHDAVDVYGKSKSIGEVPSGNMMNLRASIIGPEVDRSTSLFEWVRNQPRNAQITGYTDHHWNGVTASSFAKICKGIVEGQGFIAGVQHLIPGDSVTKSQLVREIASKTSRLDIEIVDGPSGTETDRTLATVDAAQNLKLWTAAGYKSIPKISELVNEIEL
jgi:dTDP-4-dehydrorhamnose reductase